MDIEEITGDRLNLTNVLLTVPALFVSLALAFFGFQANNLGLLVAGLVLFLLPATGLLLTKNALFNSETSFYYTALGTGVFVVPGLLGSLEISLSATPSQSYLAAALGQTSAEVTAIMNNFLAPRGENMAILGASVLALLSMKQVTDNRYVQAGVTFVPASIAFALLHGVRSPAFLLLAGGFMTAWIAIYLADDFGFDIGDQLALTTFALTVGLHQGNNTAASGGLLNYYSTILSASTPILYLSYLIILIDVVLVGYVAVKSGQIALDKLR
jgi:hypothetical protein